MEPIHSASQLRADLHEPVVTRDVRKFMGKHGSSPGRGPFLRTRRKQDARPHHPPGQRRSEEHTSELQSLTNLVCRLLLEKKNTNINYGKTPPPMSKPIRASSL